MWRAQMTDLGTFYGFFLVLALFAALWFTSARTRFVAFWSSLVLLVALTVACFVGHTMLDAAKNDPAIDAVHTWWKWTYLALLIAVAATLSSFALMTSKR
jgi:hypothetical protein